MPEQKEFVHLHVHTEFSLLDGLSQIKRLVGYAKDSGMNALAITDHGTMYGVIDFYRECKRQGIQPVIGCEAYLARRTMYDRDPKLDAKPHHLLLLAKNQTGYQNLLQIASAAQLEGHYYRPRIDHDFLERHAEGLIATSGCLAAEIPRLYEQGREEEALQQIGWYQDVFGPENFFLELQHHQIDELHVLNKWLIEHQDYANVPLLATNDVHYVLPDDFDAHDTLLCIQTGNVKSEQNRLRFNSQTFHLRTPEEMWQLFANVPEALTNSLLIADMCDVNLDSEGYHLPVFPVPEGYTAETYLRYLCERGLRWRYGSRADDPLVVDRLDYELHIIHEMGFDTYFLIVWDLCEFARHADIWWNVRGSGAGSVAAFCLGITNIDPLRNGLLFERFLNPGRVSMPDIDLDYPEDRRAEMIEYCAHKYGADKVAAIITFGTMGSKAAIRDVGRALDMPLPEVDRIARLIPSVGKPIKFKDALGDDPEKAIPELKAVYESDKYARNLIDIARQLEGITRHASTHAAGVIVADKPLVEYIPLHRPTSGSEEDAPVKMVTQFPMETCESIGLLKVDFLGLSTLTIMRRACELIEQQHGIRYDLSNIPYRPVPDDPGLTRMVEETFEMIGRGETIGVFQLESQGMRRMLTGMRPKEFENIVAAVALYRPGPMEYIPTYNRRLHGEEKVEYRHPLLEPILQETYGICISGDSTVFDAFTGQRYRVDQLGDKIGSLYVQGVDEGYQPTVGRVTHLIDNGEKPVYRVTLRSGATIKTTHDHRFLTEGGWKPLYDIQNGDYIATPPYLVEPDRPSTFNRDKLRVLAYLIADGSLASGCSVDFVNKDPVLLDEYIRCLAAFGDVEPIFMEQVREVQRIGVRHNRKYKEVNSLLAWMRELGFKYPLGRGHPRGLRSHEKSVPEFVFRLDNEDIAFFLASLWDCDGHIGPRYWHYKTISAQLARNVQTLLLRLGICSTIYESTYEHHRNGGGIRRAYQVTCYDNTRLSELLIPSMLTNKRRIKSTGIKHTTINRLRFIEEITRITQLSGRGLMAQYGIDRQHLTKKARETRPRISAHIVASVADTLPLPETQRLMNVVWEEVTSIESAGVEHVYDLTVEGIHNFVANNILVHNCVYQEQIMQIAGELFGYELGEADLMRRAVSKKKKEALQEHRQIFVERGPEHGVDSESANMIFDDIEYFARYGFNKCLVAQTEIVDAVTGRLVRIGDLADGTTTIEHTVTCDLDSLQCRFGAVTQVIANGMKPVYRLATQSGRQITATANHPFYTFDGWRLLGDLQAGDQIAVPRRIPVEGSREWPEDRVIALADSVLVDTPDAVLPGDVFELTNRQLELLVTHLWQRRAAYATRSERLARQLQHILLRLGVTSHLHQTGTGYELVLPEALAVRAVDGPSGNEPGRSRPGGSDTPNAFMCTENGIDSSDIYWDRVVAIEYVGEEMTYDLTIPETHNFVANDIIVHNSHAADYAVITCQTAFLKCHYPHEYMAALMSVHRDDAAKVGLFAVDCARMGIPVLPPDMNYSQLDFDIETQPDGTRAIRFGLGAVKNVGVGPLEHVLERRAVDGPFQDLDDLCRRVDMRIVQKRALESLIRVGALDFFGSRPVLLAALDRIHSFSADHHRAQEVGQMSLFGEATGVEFDAVGNLLENLPHVPDVDKREMLRWEKELVGLYVTDHPLSALAKRFAQANINTSADLIDAGDVVHGRRVTVAGLVADIRHVITKKGDPMAILTIEDITGMINAVMFPRTWGEYRDVVDEDIVLIVRGKADTSRGDTQIIVDSVTQDLKTVAPADDLAGLENRSFSWLVDESPSGEDDEEAGPYDEETGEMVTAAPVPSPSDSAPVMPASAGASIGTAPPLEPPPAPSSSEPPPPPHDSGLITDREMPGWLAAELDDGWTPSPDLAYHNDTGHILGEEGTEEAGEDEDTSAFDAAGRLKPPPAPAARTRDAAPPAAPSSHRRLRRTAPEPEPESEPPPGRLLKLIFTRSGVSAKDRRRMMRLHGILTQYPGHDRFCFIFEGGDKPRARMDFPNHLIGINDEMLQTVGQLLGEENVQVE